jgi:hypothetical protein
MMENTLWEYAGLEYDIFLCHTRWNHSAISQVLNDKGDVFYFSILREPVELFRSFWDYYALASTFNSTLEEYTQSVIYNELKFKNKIKSSRGYNQMLTDFGLDFNDLFREGIDGSMVEVKENVEIKVKEINQNFDLILLADKEYFEDSIILLKNSLCWEYEDMVGLPLNSRPLKYQSKISARSRKIIKGS